MLPPHCKTSPLSSMWKVALFQAIKLSAIEPHYIPSGKQRAKKIRLVRFLYAVAIKIVRVVTGKPIERRWQHIPVSRTSVLDESLTSRSALHHGPVNGLFSSFASQLSRQDCRHRKVMDAIQNNIHNQQSAGVYGDQENTRPVSVLPDPSLLFRRSTDGRLTDHN